MNITTQDVIDALDQDITLMGWAIALKNGVESCQIRYNPATQVFKLRYNDEIVIRSLGMDDIVESFNVQYEIAKEMQRKDGLV